MFLPHIGGSFLHGATFYNGSKIVMGLTVRGKDADKFWFSLFHELGHINKEAGVSIQDEKEADLFAANALILQDDFAVFEQQNCFTRSTITAFAKKINIAPGIVVGRLQNARYITFKQYNDLKTKYAIKN